MIFEDAHWIDPTSLELFGRAVNRIKTLPALLIVTYRPEFNAPWVGQSHVTSLTLNRLAERAAAAIIAHLVGDKELRGADVMAEIVFAAGAPHAPGLIGLLEAAPSDVKDVVTTTYRNLAGAVAAAKPDSARRSSGGANAARRRRGVGRFRSKRLRH